MGLIGKAAGEVFNIAERWQRAEDTMQLTSYKANSGMERNDILNRYKRDNDPNKAALYVEEMQKSGVDGLEGISNARLREQASLENQMESQLGLIKLDNMSRQKMIAYSKNVEIPKGVNDAIDSMRGVDYKSKQFKKSYDGLNIMLEANVQSYIITKAEKEKYLNDAKKGIVGDMLWKNPEAFIEELPGLVKEKLVNPKEAATLETKARNLITKRKDDIEFKENIDHTQNAITLGRELLAGTLTPERVDQMARDKDITVETSKAFMRAIFATDPDPSKSGVETFYINTLDNMIGDKDAEPDTGRRGRFIRLSRAKGAIGVVTDATEAFGDGRIGLDAYTYFLWYAEGQLKDESKKENPKLSNQLRSARDNIMALGEVYPSPYVTGEALSKAFGSFFKKLADGSTPEKAVKEVQEETVIERDPTLQTEEDPIAAAYRKEATRILKEQGYPVTEGNIKGIVDQARSAETKESIEQYNEDVKNKPQNYLVRNPPPLVGPFNPEGSGYDDSTSKEAGLERDERGHLGSLDPRTGMVLKGRKHKSWDKMVAEEKKRGNVIIKAPDGRYYSVEEAK
ncbi:MAG: hypothetical protein CMB80_02495 [Flammeovirgaceae bacterium]|nr:hypothetical protein [Flammeovirgaceae bacterium]